MVISSSSTSRPFLLLIILIIICCCCAAFSAALDDDSDQPSDDHYLGHTCSSSTFDSNSDYSHTLSLLVNDLLNNVSPGTSVMRWWPQGSTGYIYGLAMCRGDVSQRDCRACVNDAATQATKTFCPKNLSATVWRDHCELKYSDVDFYGKIDTDNNLTITNKRDLNRGSQQAANAMLGSLSQEAVSKLYASGMSLGETNMYGMAQCTSDLSKDACRACLDRAISDLSKCCGTFSGARVNFGSCNVRRETFRFLK